MAALLKAQQAMQQGHGHGANGTSPMSKVSATRQSPSHAAKGAEEAAATGSSPAKHEHHHHHQEGAGTEEHRRTVSTGGAVNVFMVPRRSFK